MESPLTAELRRAAELAGRGECPSPNLLREAADEIVGLRRQAAAWREAHQAALEADEARGEAVELLRKVVEAHHEGYCPQPDYILDGAARVLAVVDGEGGR